MVNLWINPQTTRVIRSKNGWAKLRIKKDPVDKICERCGAKGETYVDIIAGKRESGQIWSHGGMHLDGSEKFLEDRGTIRDINIKKENITKKTIISSEDNVINADLKGKYRVIISLKQDEGTGEVGIAKFELLDLD